MKNRTTSPDTTTLRDAPDDPLFWVLREAFSNNKNRAYNLGVEIERAERNLAQLKRKRDAAQRYSDAALDHAKHLGWNLIFDYEKKP